MGGAGSVELAVAVARAGGVGMLPLLAAAPIVERVARARDLLDQGGGQGVIGANVLMPFADRRAIDGALGAGIRLLEFFFGDPDVALVEVVHAAGALAGWQVGSVDEAMQAVDADCDLIIAQGVEAGGHVRGTTPLAVLVPAVVAACGTAPVIAAGGLATADDLAGAFRAGADAVRLGTRFLLTPEADVHGDYRRALLDATGDDTVLTTAFGAGWPDAPHRVLRSCVEAAAALPEAAPGRWSPSPPTRSAVGPVNAMALYAGMGIGRMSAVEPAEQLARRLWAETVSAVETAG